MGRVVGAEPGRCVFHHLAGGGPFDAHRRLRRGELEAGAGQDVAGEPLQLRQVASDARELGRGFFGAPFGGEIERYADPRERRAQLVRHVREELPLSAHQRLDPSRHLVEGQRDVAQLVAPAQVGARRQLAAAEVPRGGGEHPKRARQPGRGENGGDPDQHRGGGDGEQRAAVGRRPRRWREDPRGPAGPRRGERSGAPPANAGRAGHAVAGAIFEEHLHSRPLLQLA